MLSEPGGLGYQREAGTRMSFLVVAGVKEEIELLQEMMLKAEKGTRPPFSLLSASLRNTSHWSTPTRV